MMISRPMRVAHIGILVVVLVAGGEALAGFTSSSAGGIAFACIIAGFCVGSLWRWSGWWLICTALGIASIFVAMSSLLAADGPNRVVRDGLTVDRSPIAGSGADTLVAAGVMLLAALGAWSVLRRGRPWLTCVSIALVLTARADVDPLYGRYFPLLLVFCLVLVLTSYSSGVAPTLSSAALVAVVLALAWRMPPSAAWSSAVADPLASFIAAHSSGQEESILNMTGPFHGSDRLVMTVLIDNADARPYWRTGVFDYYDGQQWLFSGQLRPLVQADRPFTSLAAAQNASVVSATIALAEPLAVVPFPGDPVSVSLPVYPLVAPGSTSIVGARTDGTFAASTAYQVQGSPSSFSSALLPPSRSTLTADMQLPSPLTPVRQLAERITTQHGTEVAKLLSIESYLRDTQRFRYDPTTGSPLNADGVTAFLFHLHRGYCTQFASSMAIMARTIGIPARIAVGYTSGAYRNGKLFVRESDAHSWVEAYAQGLGWVSFDPTPGFRLSPEMLSRRGIRGRGLGPQTAIVTTHWDTTHRGSAYLKVAPPAIATNGRPANANDWWLILGLIAMIWCAAWILFLLRPRSISRLYADMIRSCHRRGYRLSPGTTPRELANLLRDDPRHDEVRLIAELYVRMRYSHVPLTLEEMRRARRAGWRLRLTFAPARSLQTGRRLSR